MLVITSDNEINQQIAEQWKDYLNYGLRNAANKIRERLLERTRELILANSTSQNLMTGDLAKELGIIDGRSIMEEIIVAVQESIEFDFQPITSDFKGGYIIRILKADFQDVLGIPDAAYTSSNGVLIPWLNWLLFAGESPVIYGYRVELNPNNPTNSRTGAIMVKNAGAWSVPAVDAGTQDDNFLTRALESLDEEIGNIIRQELGANT
jgi:hypothetical protein